MAFHWRGDDGPTLNTGLVFQGFLTSIAKKLRSKFTVRHSSTSTLCVCEALVSLCTYVQTRLGLREISFNGRLIFMCPMKSFRIFIGYCDFYADWNLNKTNIFVIFRRWGVQTDPCPPSRSAHEVNLHVHGRKSEFGFAINH